MTQFSGPDGRCCENCTFWLRDQVSPRTNGQCRRHPPVVTHHNHRGNHPRTGEAWYCGEHNHRGGPND